MYFRNGKEKIPRDTLSLVNNKKDNSNSICIEMPCDRPNSIDIILNQQSEKKNRSRVSLMADSPKEILTWACLIKCYAGIELISPEKSFAQNPNLIRAAFSSLNFLNESVLHVLLRSNLSQNSILSCTTWLFNLGCPLDIKNKNGLTALHVALENGLEQVAIFLASKGCELVVLKSSESWNKISIFLSENSKIADQIKTAYNNSRGSSGRLLSFQNKLRGFSYLSLIVCNRSIVNSR
jgi:hypothetical protein